MRSRSALKRTQQRNGSTVLGVLVPHALGQRVSFEEGSGPRLDAIDDPSALRRLRRELDQAAYLIGQFEAGVEAVQIFDTWAAELPNSRHAWSVARPPILSVARPSCGRKRPACDCPIKTVLVH